jgi:hypothetical protein
MGKPNRARGGPSSVSQKDMRLDPEEETYFCVPIFRVVIISPKDQSLNALSLTIVRLVATTVPAIPNKCIVEVVTFVYLSL